MQRRLASNDLEQWTECDATNDLKHWTECDASRVVFSVLDSQREYGARVERHRVDDGGPH